MGHWSASSETGVVEPVGWAYGLEIEAKAGGRTLKDGSNAMERRYPADNSGFEFFAFAALVSSMPLHNHERSKVDCLGTFVFHFIVCRLK